MPHITLIQHDHALRLAIHHSHWWSTVVKVIGRTPEEIHPVALEVALRFQAEREADAISVDTVNELAALYNIAEGRSDTGVHLRVEGEDIVHVTSTKRSSWRVNPAGDVTLTIHRPTRSNDDASRVEWEWERARTRLKMLTEYVTDLDAEVLAHEEDEGDGEGLGPRRSARQRQLCAWIQTVANAFEHDSLKALVQTIHTTFDVGEQKKVRLDLFRAYRAALPSLLDRARTALANQPVESKDVLLATIVDGKVTITRVGEEPLSVRHVLALESALVGAMGDERYYQHPDIAPLWAAVEDVDEVARKFGQIGQQIVADLFRRRSGRGFPLVTVMSPRVAGQKLEKLWNRLVWIHACHDGLLPPASAAPPSASPVSGERPAAA